MVQKYALHRQWQLGGITLGSRAQCVILCTFWVATALAKPIMLLPQERWMAPEAFGLRSS